MNVFDNYDIVFRNKIFNIKVLKNNNHLVSMKMISISYDLNMNLVRNAVNLPPSFAIIYLAIIDLNKIIKGEKTI